MKSPIPATDAEPKTEPKKGIQARRKWLAQFLEEAREKEVVGDHGAWIIGDRNHKPKEGER